MYWNNPLEQYVWPCDTDPVQRASHHSQHCLFWNPARSVADISTNQTLQDLCDWAMQWLTQDGLSAFVADRRNHYDIANLVKLNMWIHDIRQQGIVKPWLILDAGDGSYWAGTGDSRLRCLEVLPEIQTVPALISTHRDRAWLYQDLEPVRDFAALARHCRAQLGQLFLFRFTDLQAPYGLYWYEYNSELTRRVTPSESWCVTAFQNYWQHQAEPITKQWFATPRDWWHYTGTVQ